MPKKIKVSFWKRLTKPFFFAPLHSREDYERDLAQWNKEVGLDRPKDTKVQIIKNVFITKVKNKKTGEIVELNPDDYEILDSQSQTADKEEE